MRLMFRRSPLARQSSKPASFLSVSQTLLRFYCWFAFLWIVSNFIEGLFYSQQKIVPGIVYLDAFVSLPCLIGLIAAAYHFQLFWPWFWRIYTPLIFIWDQAGSYFLMMNQEERFRFLHGDWKAYFLRDILLLPMYVILVRQGFPKPSIDSGKE